MAHIERWPRGGRHYEARYHRARWAMAFLYAVGARASEAVNHPMSSIVPEADGGQTRWWWEVTGKGRKRARVPLTPGTLEELERYRRSCGLPPLPEPGESTPIIGRVRGGDFRDSITRTALHDLVKSVFQGAAADIRSSNPHAAEKLDRASTHWMRHTAITHYANRTDDIRKVQRFGRHADVRTSMRYSHVEDELFHDDVARHGPSWG
jgi:site-specific recombinase XerD